MLNIVTLFEFEFEGEFEWMSYSNSHSISGCGAVRLAHHVRDVGAAGSNPVIPTTISPGIDLGFLYQLNVGVGSITDLY